MEHHIHRVAVERLLEPARAEVGKDLERLAREQYLTDIGMWGFEDARLTVAGSMTRDEVAHWTRAITPKASE